MTEAVPLTLDCRGWKCPLPVIELAHRISEVAVGATVLVLADDAGAAPDLAAWCRMQKHQLLSSDPPRFVVRRDH